MLKRFKRTTVLVAGIVGLAMAASFAFFVGNFIVEGNHQGTVGSGGTGTANIPLSISWPENELTPTHPVALTAKFNNTAGRPITEHKISFTVAPEASGCKAEWFEVKAVKSGESPVFAEWQNLIKGESGTVTYATGEQNVINVANIELQLAMKNEASTQAACEGSKITVTGKVSPS